MAVNEIRPRLHPVYLTAKKGKSGPRCQPQPSVTLLFECTKQTVKCGLYAALVELANTLALHAEDCEFEPRRQYQYGK